MSRIGLVALVAALLVAVPYVAAQYGYGTSTISVANTNMTIAPGGTGTTSYTVTLSSGNTWGTTTNIANAGQLSAEGITASVSKSYADPTYSGTLTISVSSSVASGTYTVKLNATGDDPSSNTATVSVFVPAPPASTTTASTIPASTSIAPTVSVAPTTVAPTTVAPTTGTSGTHAANYAGYEIAAVVVIVVIAVAVFFLVSRRK